MTPNVKVEILVDGSLSLRVVDDPERSKYFPGDRFYVRYSSNLSGIDFIESFLYSESNTTIGSGSLGSGTIGSPHLVILPSDSNGTNFLKFLYPERNHTRISNNSWRLGIQYR